VTSGPLVLGLLASLVAALCATADGALLSVDEAEAAGDARVRELLADRERMHRTLAFARVLALLVAGAGLALAADLHVLPRLQRVGLGAMLALAVVAVAESASRAVGDALAGRALVRFAPLVRLLEVVLAPVTWSAARIDAALNRAFPPAGRDDVEREATAEQFRQVVAAEADVTRDEQALLLGVFSMGDTAVRDVMVPRVDIVGIDKAAPWSEVVDRVRSAEHARLPVYDEGLDEIVGIIYAKDLLPAIIADEPPADGWLPLVRQAMFIPGTKTIDQQLRDFKASGTHIAIVVDEYGGTAGLVTIEDILEEIVGDIRDEHDVEEPDVELDPAGTRAWVAGKVTIDELSEALGWRFAHDDVATVGGLVYATLGRVPRAGEQLRLGPFRVVVERVVRRRIRRVFFERVDQPAPEDES
jgi:CBS domain containing-hemolysin-like protein